MSKIGKICFAVVLLLCFAWLVPNVEASCVYQPPIKETNKTHKLPSGKTVRIFGNKDEKDNKADKEESLEFKIPTWYERKRKTPLLTVQYGHTSRMKYLAISEDGNFLATGGKNNCVKIWNTKTGELILTLKIEPDVIPEWIGNKTFYSEKRLFAISELEMRDPETGKELFSRTLYYQFPKTIRLPNGLLLKSDSALLEKFKVSMNRKGKIECVVKGEKRCLNPNLNSKPVWLNSVRFTPDGKAIVSKVVYITSRFFTICVWDKDGVSKTTDKECHYFGQPIVISPDSNFVASIYDYHNIYIWDLKTKKNVRKLDGKYTVIPSKHFSKDFKYLVNRGILYEVKSVIPVSGLMGMGIVELKEIKKKLDLTELISTSLKEFAFSPVNNTLAGGVYSNIHLIDADKGRIIKTLQGHKMSVVSVAFSPDGSKIASGSFDYTIKIWDVKTGKCLRTLTGHDYFVKSVCFSPDGKFLLSGSWDSTMKLWNPKTGELLATMINFDDGNWIAYTPEGCFDGSEGGMEKIGWTLDMTFYPFKLCKNGFYIPGLITKIFKGEKLPETPDLRKDFPEPPKVTIESVICPSFRENQEDSFTRKITVKATENAGGFFDLKLYHNGEECRGDWIKDPRVTDDHRKEFIIKLIPGKNRIKTVSFNKNQSIESKPCTMIIDN